jgi:hypothetical protein
VAKRHKARPTADPTVEATSQTKEAEQLAPTPSHPFLFGLTGIIYPIVAAVLVVIAAWKPIRDPDFWFHLTFAEILRQTGGFPATDTLSHTSGGGTWISSGWGGSLVLEWLMRIWTDQGLQNGSGVLLFVSLCGLASVLLPYIYGLRRSPGAILPFALFLVILANSTRFVPRPDILSHIFFPLLLIGLLRLDQAFRTQTLPSLAQCSFVPAVMVLWGNFHAGFIIGLPVLLLFVLYWMLKSGTHVRSLANTAIGQRLLVIAGGLISWILNPYGPVYLKLPWTISQINEVQVIFEWKPLLVINPEEALYWPVILSFLVLVILTGLLLFAAAFLNSTDSPAPGSTRYNSASESGLAPWWLLASVALVVVMAFAQRRHIPLATLGMLLLVGLYARVLEEHLRSSVWLRQILPAATAAAVFGILWTGAQGVQPGRPVSGRDCAALPCHLAIFFEENPPPRNLYNEYALGGYFTNSIARETPVFIDGRLDVYPASVWTDYLLMQRGEKRLPDLIETYGIKTFALQTNKSFMNPLDLVFILGELEREYQLVHFDDFFAAYVRLEESTTSYTAQFGFKHLHPWHPQRTVSKALNSALRQEMVEEATRALRQSNQSAASLTMAALVSIGTAIDEGSGDALAEAIELLERARNRRPESPLVLYGMEVLQRTLTLKDAAAANQRRARPPQ